MLVVLRETYYAVDDYLQVLLTAEHLTNFLEHFMRFLSILHDLLGAAELVTQLLFSGDIKVDE